MTEPIHADAPTLASSNEAAALSEAATAAMVAEVRAEQLKAETTKAETLTAANEEREAELGGKAPAEAPAEPPVVPQESDDGLPKLAVLLRARERAKATTDAAKTEAHQVRERAMAEAQQERDRIIADARERGRKEYEAELEKVRKLRTSPLEAIGEIGWDRKQLVDEVALAGTPQYQMMKRLEARAEAAEKKLQEVDAWRGESQKQQEVWQQQQAAQAKSYSEQQFLSIANKEVAPNLRTLYPDDRKLLREAYDVVERLRTEAGHDPSREEIRDYLEHEAKREIARLRADQAAAAATDATKRPAKPPSPGPRSLSASATSERRATPKSAPSYASSSEEYLALKEAADVAMRDAAAPEKKGA